MNGLSISPSDIYLETSYLTPLVCPLSPPLSQGQSKDTLSMGPGSTGWSTRIYHNYRISHNGSVCSGVESVAFPISRSLDYPVRRGEKGEAYIRVWRRSPSCDPCATMSASRSVVTFLSIWLSLSPSKFDASDSIYRIEWLSRTIFNSYVDSLLPSL